MVPFCQYLGIFTLNVIPSNNKNYAHLTLNVHFLVYFRHSADVYMLEFILFSLILFQQS